MQTRTPKLLCLGLAALSAALVGCRLRIVPRRAHFASSTLSLRHRKGVVTRLVNRLTGETYTLGKPPTAFTPGVRVFGGVGRGPRDATAAEASLDSEARVEGNEILLRQTARTYEGGCASVRFVVGPFDLKKVKLLIPAFDGVAIGEDTKLIQAEYAYPSTWATPMPVVQGEKGGVMIRALDPRRPFLRLGVRRMGDGVQCALETEADAPWEKQTHVESPVWHFEAYEGNWVVAAEKYRKLMQEGFALTPRAGRAPAWARKIRSVVTVVTGKTPPSGETLRALASRVPPETVLLYFVHWRTHSYDVMYPDYEAPPEAVDFIRRARKLGFRVMVHGNLVGISPRYAAIDRFRDVLQRSPYTHKEVGWFLERECPNQIYCLNPASPMARRLLIDAFVKAHKQCLFDALHLDSPVITNADSGRLDGLNTIQGAEVYLRELQDALPGVALGMEGLSDYLLPCSFAQLIGSRTNLGESFGRYHPITSSLFGPFCQRYMHLSIPGLDADQLPAYLNWQYISDRLGALPSLRLGGAAFDADSVAAAFVLGQMRFWGQRQPEPDFHFLASAPETWRGLGRLLYGWKLSDGRHAATVDAKDGTHLFAQSQKGKIESAWHVVRGTREVRGSRQVLGGWLAYDAERLFGLDPRSSYLLTEGEHARRARRRREQPGEGHPQARGRRHGGPRPVRHRARTHRPHHPRQTVSSGQGGPVARGVPGRLRRGRPRGHPGPPTLQDRPQGNWCGDLWRVQADGARRPERRAPVCRGAQGPSAGRSRAEQAAAAQRRRHLLGPRQRQESLREALGETGLGRGKH